MEEDYSIEDMHGLLQAICHYGGFKAMEKEERTKSQTKFGGKKVYLHKTKIVDQNFNQVEADRLKLKGQNPKETPDKY